MRFLTAFLTVLLVSCASFASGKISIQPYDNGTSGKAGINAGLSIYQHLLGPLSFASYEGVGYEDSALNWMTAKNGVVVQIKAVSFELGLQLKRGSEMCSGNCDLGMEKITYLKVGMNLW